VGHITLSDRRRRPEVRENKSNRRSDRRQSPPRRCDQRRLGLAGGGGDEATTSGRLASGTAGPTGSPSIGSHAGASPAAATGTGSSPPSPSAGPSRAAGAGSCARAPPFSKHEKARLSHVLCTEEVAAGVIISRGPMSRRQQDARTIRQEVWVVVVAEMFSGTDQFTVPQEYDDGGLNPNIHPHPRTGLSFKAKSSEVRCASSRFIPCCYLLTQCVPLWCLSFICTSSLAFIQSWGGSIWRRRRRRSWDRSQNALDEDETGQAQALLEYIRAREPCAKLGKHGSFLREPHTMRGDGLTFCYPQKPAWVRGCRGAHQSRWEPTPRCNTSVTINGRGQWSWCASGGPGPEGMGGSGGGGSTMNLENASVGDSGSPSGFVRRTEWLHDERWCTCDVRYSCGCFGELGWCHEIARFQRTMMLEVLLYGSPNSEWTRCAHAGILLELTPRVPLVWPRASPNISEVKRVQDCGNREKRSNRQRTPYKWTSKHPYHTRTKNAALLHSARHSNRQVWPLTLAAPTTLAGTNAIIPCKRHSSTVTVVGLRRDRGGRCARKWPAEVVQSRASTNQARTLLKRHPQRPP